jgi:branched-chain amino acid transport system substrate-binding protein
MLAVTLVVSACGADGESGDGNGPIKIMVTETLSSPTMSFPQSAAGAQAAADSINAAGGVDGRDIEIIECNDEMDPNKAAACVQQAVDEGVVALVGVLHLFSAQLWPRLEAAKLPFIGLDANSPDQAQNPLSYPVTAGVPGIYLEAGRLAVEHGGEKVVLLLPDIPQADYVRGYAEQSIAMVGGKVVEAVRIDLGAPDMSSPAAQVVRADPDGVVCVCNPGDAPRVLKSMRQQGYDGAFAASYSTFSQSDIDELGPLANKLYNPANIRTPDDPKAAQWVAEMKKYAPKAKQDAVSAHTWVATHIIADLLTGKDKPTSATLVEALNSAESLDTRGLTGGTLTFTKDGPLKDAPRVTNTSVVVYGTNGGVREPLSENFVDALRKP